MKKEIQDEINSEKAALESVATFIANEKGEINEENNAAATENSHNGEIDYRFSRKIIEEPPKEPRSKLLSFAIFALSLILAFGFGIVVRNYVLTPVQVSQTSMFDTLSDGDRLYINRLDKGEQFDIVVIYEPLVSQNWLIKRIIATGGQEVEIVDGILYITDNGITTAYNEEYVNGENITQERVYIPEGYIYVLGDNRQVSVDSSNYGVISWDKVVGTAIFIDSEEAVAIDSYS